MFCIAIATSVNSLQANDSTLSHLLIQRLALLQSKSNQVFSKGSFASYRSYSWNKSVEKADENAFFTGLICFTLKNILNDLDEADKRVALKIIEQSVPYFEHFKNQKGRNTYNFWSTLPPQIFPHSGWMNLFNRSQSLPDDFDDTVMILMALNVSDSIANQVHQLMQGFVNGNDKKIRNTFDEYKNFPAYSTWFGKKMPLDFDVSVLTNVLYFVQEYHLKWTVSDSAILHLIAKVIEDKKYLESPSGVSPHYNRTPVILYHLSRLMQIQPIPTLEKYKLELIQATQKQLKNASSFMDQTILSTALLRWGVNPDSNTIKTDQSLLDLIDDPEFVFFIANMSSMLPNPAKDMVGRIGIGKFAYYCEAYNICLLLENIIWQKRLSLH